MNEIKKPWIGSFNPFRIFGNLYFAGTVPASVHIIDTGAGLIMLDAAYDESHEEITNNIRQLGFDPHDIKYIMLTHGHIDHLGGAKSMKLLSGAKICLGEPDREYANGRLDLSYAKELGMAFSKTFEPDILLHDGDTIELGSTKITAVATPGHTPGAMSYFFDVTDGISTFRAALHGGMGINTLCKEFLDKYNLPYSLRDSFVSSMHRLNEEHVDIFLGNHMQHNHTEERAKLIESGNTLAFVNPDEWQQYNLWCIGNLKNMIHKEKEG